MNWAHARSGGSWLGSDGDEAAKDQGENAGEGRAGNPLYNDDLAFQGFDFATDGRQLGIDVVEPALMVSQRLDRRLRLFLGCAGGPQRLIELDDHRSHGRNV